MSLNYDTDWDTNWYDVTGDIAAECDAAIGDHDDAYTAGYYGEDDPTPTAYNREASARGYLAGSQARVAEQARLRAAGVDPATVGL